MSLRDLNLNSVCAAIAARVKAANAEIDCRDYPAPQSGKFPVFYIEVPALTYRSTSRKSDFELRGVILVANGPNADSVRQLRDYLEPSALLADIEGSDRTLGGLVDHIAVTGCSELSLEEFMSIGAWGASLTIQIMGKTT